MKKFIVTAAAVATLFVGAASADAFNWNSGQSLLQVGSRGAQVMDLQICLAALDNNPVSNVDGAFGPITKNAVMLFQAENGLLVDGIIGNQTGPYFEAACDLDADDMDDMDDDEDDDNDSSLGGGEASLEDYDLQSEDDAEEGDMKHVATASFDVEDADAEINRVDVSFDSSSVTGNADTDPWDVFETITLTVDGDEIAEEDIDDEDDWLDDDGAVTVFRLSGIDYVAEEDEEVEIEIHLTAQNNVDDAGSDATWIISIEEDGIRAVDSEDVQNYTGGTDTVTFDVDPEGGDESIEIQSSSNDPDEATLVVDNDDDSDWMEVFVFELESEENDIEIDEIVLTVAAAGEVYNDLVNDIRLVIDGEEFDDFDVTNGGTASATVTFDIDKDYTVEADESEDVVVEIEFKDTNDQVRYQNGDTIQVSTVSVDGEGADDVSDTASVSGEVHTLVAEGLIDSYDSKSSEAQDLGDDTIAVFTFEFELEAVEDTFYIAEDQGIGLEANGFGVTVSDGTITDVTISDTSADLVASGTAYEINEGSSESFTLEVTVVSDGGAGVAQAVRATVDNITYDTQSGLAGTDATLDLGAPDYRSGTVTVIDAV